MTLPSQTGTITVTDGKCTLGIIIRRNFSVESTSFLTADDSAQQVALMSYSANQEIEPHIHNHAPRTVKQTQEVLIVTEGKLRVDFYSVDCTYFISYIVAAGDVLLLCQGGHGFYFLEHVRMIEIKNGPYIGDGDRTKFPPINSSDVILTQSQIR